MMQQEPCFTGNALTVQSASALHREGSGSPGNREVSAPLPSDEPEVLPSFGRDWVELPHAHRQTMGNHRSTR
jgi:hypothetical protein